MAIQTINPVTNALIQTFEAHTPAQIENMLETADQTFKTWRKTTFAERAALMKKAAEVLRGQATELGRIITLEMGKPLKEAVAEINKCATVCDFYAQHAEEFLKDEPVETKASKSFIAFEPLGTVLAVMPWNFPFWQVFRFAAPALMAGNVGLLKHASNVPQCALAIEKVFAEAGFPKGCFQSLLIESDAVEAIIKDDRIKAVTLTGSEGAGASVGSIAGKAIKKTVLELGGSDAFVVLEDADLELASDVAVQSRMINTGQSCIAAKRFIVAEKIAPEFAEKMKAKMAKLKSGDLEDEQTGYGPLARKDLAEGLEKQVLQSIEKGAEIWLDGGRSDKDSAYFHPMILTRVKPGMPAFDEELFGPVASIITVKDEAEAIAMANLSPYGLGGSVWTSNIANGERIARQIESGAVFINALVHSSPEMPFGGIKKSGYGRELSYLGIREFTNQKSVWVG